MMLWKMTDMELQESVPPLKQPLGLQELAESAFLELWNLKKKKKLEQPEE